MARSNFERKKRYFEERTRLLKDAHAIERLERDYQNLFVDICHAIAPRAASDFDVCAELIDFWEKYAPRQRGYKPRGDSYPWGEVAEKSVSFEFLRALNELMPDVQFVGLPFGGDIRFVTDKAFVHIDLKLTGPNDNPNEVVSSPNQLSGDGADWDDKGVINSPVLVKGPRRNMQFQPELPPLFVFPNGGSKLCLTYYLKLVYRVESLGCQPLDTLEMACVPNGLLMFADTGPKLGNTKGLLTPGKDEQKFVHKRTRVKLDPLAGLASWRCVKVVRIGDKWVKQLRREDQN